MPCGLPKDSLGKATLSECHWCAPCSGTARNGAESPDASTPAAASRSRVRSRHGSAANPASSPTQCGHACCGPACTWKPRTSQSVAAAPIRRHAFAHSPWCGCLPDCEATRILRLRKGCVRWQATPDAPGAKPVCLLDVPTHKTGSDFTKPVDPEVGHAIEAWEAVRPPQPRCADRKRRGTRRAAVHVSGARHPARAPQPVAHPGVVPQGGRGQERRARRHHQPPRTGYDRQPALQQPRADVPVRTPGLAWPQFAGIDPALRCRHPDPACQGLHRPPATSNAICAP